MKTLAFIIGLAVIIWTGAWKVIFEIIVNTGLLMGQIGMIVILFAFSLATFPIRFVFWLIFGKR